MAASGRRSITALLRGVFGRAGGAFRSNGTHGTSMPRQRRALQLGAGAAVAALCAANLDASAIAAAPAGPVPRAPALQPSLAAIETAAPPPPPTPLLLSAASLATSTAHVLRVQGVLPALCQSAAEEPSQYQSVPLDTSKLKCQMVCNTSGGAGGGDGTRTEARHAPQVVLVSCGSFNPVTVMHMNMVERARDHLSAIGYQVLGAFLSPVNDGYGKPGLLEARHRLAMCRRACEESELTVVDEWEARQASFVHTLAVLDRIHLAVNAFGPDESESESRVRVMLVCGSDLLATMPRPGVWRQEQVETLLSNYGVVCIDRNGTDGAACIQEHDILRRHQDNIHVVAPQQANVVSSTQVRRGVLAGECVQHLVPSAVAEYIAEHRLYQAS